MNGRFRYRSNNLLGSLAASVCLILLLAGCSSSKHDESRVEPCTSPITCGSPCSSSGTCGPGQYCAANQVCTADCVPGDDRCGTDQTCSSTGKCVASGTGPGGIEPGMINPGKIDPGNGDAGADPDSDACVKLDVTFTPQVPTVVMLIDQSGSMKEPFGTGLRWNVLRDALIDPTSGIISTLQSKVRFGLALYTSHNGFNQGGGRDGEMRPPEVCPILTEVAPALNNYMAISDKYLPDDWKGDTPTGESVDAAVKILAAVKDEGPKAIVLATDGEPDSCADPNPVGQTRSDAARQLSVSAVQNAYKQGITTFVISVGNEVGEDHLRAVANAGQGLAVDVDDTKRFYLTNNQAELASAFDAIVSGVRSCVLTLNGSVEASDAASGSVILDGKSLAYQDANGWRLNAPSELELLGSACASIKHGDHDLKISFPCGVIVPIPK